MCRNNRLTGGNVKECMGNTLPADKWGLPINHVIFSTPANLIISAWNEVKACDRNAPWRMRHCRIHKHSITLYQLLAVGATGVPLVLDADERVDVYDLSST